MFNWFKKETKSHPDILIVTHPALQKAREERDAAERKEKEERWAIAQQRRNLFTPYREALEAFWKGNNSVDKEGQPYEMESSGTSFVVFQKLPWHSTRSRRSGIDKYINWRCDLGDDGTEVVVSSRSKRENLSLNFSKSSIERAVKDLAEYLVSREKH